MVSVHCLFTETTYATANEDITHRCNVILSATVVGLTLTELIGCRR